MKKVLLILFSCFILSACSDKEDPRMEKPLTYPSSFSAQTEDFKYELKVGKEHYSSGKNVEITASLTYIGEGEEVTISHAASPFYFDMEELTREYRIDYPMNTPLIYTTLKKNSPLEVTYRPAGGYSDLDSAEFIAFMDELLSGNFPNGYYVVLGSAQFKIEGKSYDINMNGQVGFKVE